MASYNSDNSRFSQNTCYPHSDVRVQHPANQMVPPERFHSPSFHQKQEGMFGYSQLSNPSNAPHMHNQMPHRPNMRPRGPQGVPNWNGPPRHNPSIMAGDRLPNRFTQNTNFGHEMERFPIRIKGPPGGFQENLQFTGQQPLTSVPAESHGMMQPSVKNPELQPPAPNLQCNNFTAPHMSSIPPKIEANAVTANIPNQDFGVYNYSGNIVSRNSSDVRLQCQDNTFTSMPASLNNRNNFQGNAPPDQRFHHQSDKIRQPMPYSLKNTQISPFPSQSTHDHSSTKGNRHGTEVEIQKKTEDQVWLATWLKKKKLMKDCKDSTQGDTEKKINFPRAKSLVKETVTMIAQLKVLINELKEDGLHEDTRKEKLEQAEAIKVRLEEIKVILNDADVQNHLSTKLVQRRNMRERKKRKRKLQYEARVEEETRRKEKHEKIDKWQQAIYDKIQDEKREKELKAIADKTLQEVNRKMSDVNKCLQVLDSLHKLREVRKDSMQRKGLFPPKDSGPMFKARFNIQREALEKQKKLYEAEKGLLEVMLKTEQEECKEYEEQEVKRNREEKEQEIEQIIREHLFGQESKPEPGSAMYGFWLFYNAASQSTEGLIAIRSQWDCYLTSESTPGAGVLPSTWVIPGPPSSEVWASVLKS